MDFRLARLVRAAFGVAVLAALSAPAAEAAPAVGLAAPRTLVNFDTSALSDVRLRPITGLQNAGETAVGMDMRPATGEVFLVTVPSGAGANALVRTYKLDPLTAAATFVGSIPNTVPGAADVPTGVDFNPRVDRIRVVNSNNANFRINPNNGSLAANDVNLTYTAPATGPVTGVAHDRNVAPGPPGTPPGTTPTTLYGIDVASDRLVVQGGIDGAGSGGPNAGLITSIGPLGVSVLNTSNAGFDIAPDGSAYAVLQTGLAQSLYTVNLSTGAATLVGQIGANMQDITILAADNCPTVSGDNQADLDGDGAGDACDPDIDEDGLTNAAETARGTDPRNPDTDADGLGDASDACPTLAGTAAKNGCDGTAPTIAITRTPRRMKRKRFFHGVVTRISAGEAARLDVALLGRARSARVARTGDIVLAERHLGLSARTRSLRLKPRRALVSRSRRFSVRLRVTATDAAGNSATRTRTIRVRR
jgi:hypothetical protein